MQIMSLLCVITALYRISIIVLYCMYCINYCAFSHYRHVVFGLSMCPSVIIYSKFVSMIAYLTNHLYNFTKFKT